MDPRLFYLISAWSLSGALFFVMYTTNDDFRAKGHTQIDMMIVFIISVLCGPLNWLIGMYLTRKKVQ